MQTLIDQLKTICDEQTRSVEEIGRTRDELMVARRDTILKNKLLAGVWRQVERLPYLELCGDYDEMVELFVATHPRTGVWMIHFDDGVVLEMHGATPRIVFTRCDIETIRKFKADNEMVFRLGFGVNKTEDAESLRDILNLFE